MFNTQLWFEKKNNACKLINHATAVIKLKNDDENQDSDKNMNWKNNHVTLVKLNCNLNTDDNVSTYYNSDSNSEINNDVNAGLDETECLLWRHIIFIITFNHIFEALNILFVKVTLTYMKEENNHPQE